MKKNLVTFPISADVSRNNFWLWNIHVSNQMTTLNNILFKKYLWCKFQLHAKRKIKAQKRQLTNPTLLRVSLVLRTRVTERLNFLHLQKTKHSKTGQTVNTTRVSYDKNGLIYLTWFYRLLLSSYWSCCITPVQCKMKISISTFYQNIDSVK